MVKKLRNFLERAGVSQREVADSIGWERNIPAHLWPTLKDLAYLKPPHRTA
jgi:hypothetical protein